MRIYCKDWKNILLALKVYTKDGEHVLWTRDFKWSRADYRGCKLINLNHYFDMNQIVHALILITIFELIYTTLPINNIGCLLCMEELARF